MSPHDQTCRPICCSTTDYGVEWQCRSWLPDGIGGVMWLAPSRPCSSTFVPFYAGITSVPYAWTTKPPNGAYASFRAVADSLDKKGTVGGELRYKYYIPLVRSTYGAFETDCISQQASVDCTARGLWRTSPAQAWAYLTGYSAQRANQAVSLAQQLLAQMP
jgi:dipeptidase